MHFAFTEDQLALRDGVRDLLQKECTPEKVRACWINETGRVPELWAKLAAAGIVGATAPEEAGGLALTPVDWVLLFEEAGRVALPEPLIEHTAVAIPLLAEAGTPALKEAWLGKAAAGKALISVGLSPGGDPFVNAAREADLLLMQIPDGLHAVTRDRVELEAQTSVDGSRRIAIVDFWPNVETRVGAAKSALGAAFDRGALAAAATLIGLGQTMLDMTVEYAKVRTQFGRPIGSFQAVKHQLVDALSALEFARPMVYRAAWSLSTLPGGDPEAKVHVSMAKTYASEAATSVAKTALQCHGAIGYTTEYDLHMWMKRSWALASTWGDPKWHRDRVAAALLQPDAR